MVPLISSSISPLECFTSPTLLPFPPFLFFFFFPVPASCLGWLVVR